MPRPSKGLTRAYALKLTESEHEAVEALRAKFRENHIALSYNDAVRAYVRHGFDPAPADLDGVQRAIERHTANCEWCAAGLRCPFGWRLIAIRAAFERNAPTNPAPPADRRTAAGRRPLLPPPPGANS